MTTVEIFPTEAGLLAAQRADGAIGFADDTQTYFARSNAAWSVTPTLAALLSAIGNAEVTLPIFTELPLGAGEVTLPARVRLRFEAGGRVKFQPDETLIVEGGIEAGTHKIFDYADDSACVHFKLTGKTPLYPEWWGAFGNGVCDDSDGIQRAFDCPSPLDQQNEIVFTSGKTYRITRMIQVGNAKRAGIVASSYVVRGWGALIKALAAPLGAQPAFKLGRFAGADDPDNAKLFYLDWLGLSVERDQPPQPGESAGISTGLAIAWCDFATFRHCRVNGFHTGIRYVEDGGNSNLFDHVSVAASVVGARLGGTPDGNGWRWAVGKVQQCDVGIHASGATVTIEDVDLSLCRQSALRLDGVAESRFKFYTEGVGFGENNTNAVVEMNNCTGVLLQSCRINGAHLDHDNAAFGIHMRACRAVRVTTTLFTRHQVADVHVASDCEDIVIDEDNRQTTLVAAGDGKLRQVTKIRVDDETHGRIHDLVRLRDVPRHHGPAFSAGAALNLIESPDVFDHQNWKLSGGASLGGLTLAPDGVSQARIVRLPVPGQSTLALQVTPQGPIQVPIQPGVTRIVLRYWWQGMAMPAHPQPRRGLRSYLQCGTQLPEMDWSYLDADGVYTGHGDWQFEEHVFTPSVNQPLEMVFFQCSEFFGAAVDVALWGVQLFATDDLRRHVPVVGA